MLWGEEGVAILSPPRPRPPPPPPFLFRSTFLVSLRLNRIFPSSRRKSLTLTPPCPPQSRRRSIQGQSDPRVGEEEWNSSLIRSSFLAHQRCTRRNSLTCVRSRLVGHGGDQFPKLERGDRYVRIRTRVSLGGPPTPESTCIHPGRSDDKDSFGGTALELLFPSSLYSQNYIDDKMRDPGGNPRNDSETDFKQERGAEK